jgi:protein SCO1/2
MTQILKDKPWMLGVLVLVIAGLGFGVWTLSQNARHEWHGAAYDPPREDIAFTLTNTDGETVSESDLEGKVVLLYFGYTFCPDFCPATLTDFQRVKAELGEDADDVAFVMITVDPERDTPERLKDYLSFFDEDFIGLTGTPEDIEPVKQQFGIISKPGDATPQPDGSDFYFVDHSTQTYVLNQDGELALEYAWGTSADDITADVRYMLDS